MRGDNSPISIADPDAGSSAGNTLTEASITISRCSMSAPALVATSSVWRVTRACERNKMLKRGEASHPQTDDSTIGDRGEARAMTTVLNVCAEVYMLRSSKTDKWPAGAGGGLTIRKYTRDRQLR